MAVAEASLLDTRAAFDGVAAAYHRDNQENVILRGMRRRVIDEVRRRVRWGDRLLDLGCGPGTDVETLAALGHHVTGIDWSPAMVLEAQARIERAGLARRATVRHLGIQDLDRLAPSLFDVVYSNFGALNCVPDLAATAPAIAARLRPGGFAIVSIIGRFCPWEIALFATRGQFLRIAVRFARSAVPVPLNGRVVWTRYYTARACVRMFAAARLALVSRCGLGVFTPPPYAHAFAERHPRLLASLERADDGVASWPLLRDCGDHFLLVLRKV